MVPMVEHTAQVRRVQAEVLDCRKCLSWWKEEHPAIKLWYKYIQMAVLPKVRSALCAASQWPGEGPTDVEDAPAPAR